jgi:hypothetical protein
LETAADAPKRHLRIWLDPQQNEFLRLDYDLLADEGSILRGSKGSFYFTYIDGVMLETNGHFDSTFMEDVPLMKVGSLGYMTKAPIRHVNDQTFSNYRKFATSIRILPDDENNAQLDFQ